MLKWFNKHLIKILLPIFIMGVVFGALILDQEKINCTNVTTGTVTKTKIKIRQEDDGRDNVGATIRLHTPTILYSVNGQNYEKEFSGTVEPIWQVGQEVSILYNPDKPKVSILPKEHDLYARRYTKGGIIFTTIMCIVFFILSIIIGTRLDKNRQRNALKKQGKKTRTIAWSEGEKEKKSVFKIYVKPIAMMILFFIYIDIVDKLGETSIFLLFAGIALPVAVVLGTFCYLLRRQDSNENKNCSVCVVGHLSGRFLEKNNNGSKPVKISYQYLVITYCDQDGVQRKLVSPGGFSLRKGQTTVKLWYNPENPNEAFIEGAHRFQWRIMGLMVFMAVYLYSAVFLGELGYWRPVFISFPFVFIGLFIYVFMLLKPKAYSE